MTDLCDELLRWVREMAGDDFRDPFVLAECSGLWVELRIGATRVELDGDTLLCPYEHAPTTDDCAQAMRCFTRWLLGGRWSAEQQAYLMPALFGAKGVTASAGLEA